MGFMGSGKSVVALQIARRLVSLPWFDTDQLLVRSFGCSIQVFFRRYGEQAFRCQEREIVHRLLEGPTAVLSMGGGVVLCGPNRKKIIENGFVVHLRLPWPATRERLERCRGEHRPLWIGSMLEREALFWRRMAGYAGADYVVDSGSSPPDRVARDIVTRWQSYRGSQRG